MIVFPKAKINVGLRITGKRNDGFHDIETLFYPVNLCDALEIVVNSNQADGDVITLTGYRIKENNEKNLVIKAIKRLRESFPIPFTRVHLHKIIPAGAGLGGGSSDAACALRTLRKMFNLPLNNNDLVTIATDLGSDCPFFIDVKPAFARGKGELLSSAGKILDDYYILLLNPGIPVSTKEAYENCIPTTYDEPLAELTKKPVEVWKDHIINDFEKTVFEIHPRIRIIKEALYNSGALYSSMSGSGSSVYGIFHEKPQIKGSLRKLLMFEGSLKC
jgi:4-diphosphocytidyl-2-C-methyl-D-erythritol kinase